MSTRCSNRRRSHRPSVSGHLSVMRHSTAAAATKYVNGTFQDSRIYKNYHYIAMG